MRNNEAFFAIDLETTALRPERGRIRCCQLAWADGERFIDCDKEDLREILSEYQDKTFVAFYSEFERKWIKYHTGLDLDIVDAAHYRMAHLGGKVYSLENIIKWDFRHQLDKGVRGSDWDVEQLSDEQIEYAMEDARWTWRLYEKYKDAPAWIFGDATPGVMEMDMYGITLDPGLHEEFVSRTTRSRDYIESRLKGTADINWRSTKQVGEFVREWFPPYFVRRWPRTATGLLSMDADTVKHMAYAIDYPFSRLLAAKQVYSKRSTYLSFFGESLMEKADEVNRVYPKYVIGGAATGRFVCRKPNLQQMPRAGWFRNMFVPEEGKSFVVADYSQIELRIAAELAGDDRMQEIFEQGEDIHDATARNLFGENFTSEERHFCKGVSFGILYGQGSESLGHRIGVTVAEADEYIRRWLDTYDGVRRWRMGLDRRFAKTVTGRRVKIPYDKKMTASYNYPIQGSAADLMLRAIKNVKDIIPTSVKMVATVHDELILEASDGKDLSDAKRYLETGMQQAWDDLFETSSKVVDAGSGKSWAKAKYS